MEKATTDAPHLSPGDIQAKIRQTKGFWRVRKWLVIWHAAIDPAPAGNHRDAYGMSGTDRA